MADRAENQTREPQQEQLSAPEEELSREPVLSGLPNSLMMAMPIVPPSGTPNSVMREMIDSQNPSAEGGADSLSAGITS